MNFIVCGYTTENDYEVFAPSHPQAVNQYVREYNYYAGEEEPEYSYEQDLIRYHNSVARKYRTTDYMNVITVRARCFRSNQSINQSSVGNKTCKT